MLRLVLVFLLAPLVAADDESFAMDFLAKYNYLSSTRSGNHDPKIAIETYQAFMGLPRTGVLDRATLSEMKKPRCGIADVQDPSTRAARYGKWRKTSLTYSVSYGEDIPHSAQERIFRQAFDTWSAATRFVLKFRRVTRPADADLKISFGGEIHRGPGEGQCYSKFDGKHGVLAHAYFPENGRIHFDEAESWGDASIWPWHYNLLPTSIHEFGHALGLSHSNVKGSVMWPSYTKNTKLHQSDIARIRNLYR